MSSRVLRKMAVEIDLTGNGEEELKKWDRELRESRTHGKEFTGGINEMEREMIEYAKKIGLTTDQLQELQKQSIKNKEIGDFAKKYGYQATEVKKLAEEAQNAEGKFGKLHAAMGAVAAIGIGVKIKSIAGEMVNLAASYEQSFTSFKVMLGDAEKARKVMDQLNDFSNRTPYDPAEVIASGRALMAMGVKLEDLETTLQRVGDVAAGVNMPFKELADIYGKNLASGKVQMEDINQLAGRGIPIMDELAKVFGVSTQQVRDLSSQGKIGFKHLEEAFKNMTSAGGKYYGMMAEQSKTFSGLMSTLTGQINYLKTKLGEALLPILKPIVSGFIEITSAITQNKTAMNILKTAIIVAIPVIVTMVGGLLVNAFRTAGREAMKLAMKVAAATWPFLLIAAVIGALILVIEDLYVWIQGGESLIGGWIEKLLGAEKAHEIMWALEKIKIFLGNLFNWIIQKGKTFFDWFSKAFAPVINAVKKNIGPIKEALGTVFSVIWEIGSLIFSVLGDIFSFLAPIFGFVLNVIGTILGGIFEVIGFILGGIFKVGSAIVSFVAGIVGKIVGFFKTIYKKVKDVLGAVWDFLFGDDKKKEIVVKGEIAGKDRKVKGHRATGGPVDAGETYKVGEHGEELFTPNRSGYIIPNNRINRGSSNKQSPVVINIAPTLNFFGDTKDSDAESIKEKVMQALEELLPHLQIALGMEVG